MNKTIFNLTLKKNTTCKTAKDFTDSYFENSYYHYSYLTDTYTIHSYNNTEFNDAIIYKNIRWYFLNLNSVFNILKLARIINKEEKPVVFVNGLNTPVHLLLLRVLLKKKVRIIVQHHAEKPYINTFKLFIQQLAYKHLSGYIFVTKVLAEQFIKNKIITKNDFVYEIMEGSTLFQLKDKSECRKYLKLESETIFIWVGRLDDNKDPLTVLKAFKDYKQQNDNFKLYMFYHLSPLEKQVKDYISENNLLEHVILSGNTPHAELENWYNAADFFISASHYEGSGYAFCESMACGCIPIVSRIPSFNMMTNKGLIGKSFEVANSKELLSKLLESENTNVPLERLSVRTYFENQLSFPSISGQYRIIIKNLLL